MGMWPDSDGECGPTQRRMWGRLECGMTRMEGARHGPGVAGYGADEGTRAGFRSDEARGPEPDRAVGTLQERGGEEGNRTGK